ncbi:MAG: hypothetical protein H6919_10615 [Sphingomonadaceae bacterium]|nr:hypothetical protein [Sphingomonadaceae bacterium]
MAFRSDEAAEAEFERARRYLIKHDWPSDLRYESLDILRELTYEYGPVVSRYPTWHPFVRNHDPHLPEVWPNERTGFRGLDHTVGFVNAFVTCPYAASGNAELLRNSLREFPQHHVAYISIEPLNAQFYNEKAEPVLVVCHWNEALEASGQIPKSLALPLMIENEMRSWSGSQIAERWDTMQPYLLGEPHGARSSLFVGQDTAIAMKKAYMGMVESGMFGPLRMG